MRRKLDLAMTLVGDPAVIYLDEPTTGLDPRSRRTMWDIVRELVDDGVTILLTTQYLEEADRLADRVGVLDRGRLVAEGTPEELKRRVGGGHLVLRLADPRALDKATAALVGTAVNAAAVDDAELTVQVPCDGSPAAVMDVLDRATAAAPDGVTGFAMHTPDLDDVFLALTGRPTTEQVPA
jgi:ABC-2 type transport system ATP-binding protein